MPIEPSMKNILNSGLRIVLFLFLVLSSQNLYSQPHVLFDEIVYKIYNQDFSDVESKIKELKKISPHTANYLQIDYLWWKMISLYTDSNKLKFLTALNELNSGSKTTDFKNYDRLIYFTYQIRYENLTNKGFSKYLTSLKFHFFLENVNWDELKNSDSFAFSMFALMNELNEFMRCKFLNEHGLKTKNNIEKCRLSLQTIDRMYNSEYKSFDVVKTYLLAKIYKEIERNNEKALDKFMKLALLFPENTIFAEAVADCKKTDCSTSLKRINEKLLK